MVFTRNEQKILLELKNLNGSILTRFVQVTGMTAGCATKIINKIEKMNLVRSERIGRKRIITATEKGIKISEMMNQIDRLLKS
jgi:predicted transcriptional regulator